MTDADTIPVPESGIALCVAVAALSDVYDQACLLLEQAADATSDPPPVSTIAVRAARYRVNDTIYTLDRLVHALERLERGTLTRGQIVELT
jgi:hypothetical protein